MSGAVMEPERSSGCALEPFLTAACNACKLMGGRPNSCRVSLDWRCSGCRRLKTFHDGIQHQPPALHGQLRAAGVAEHDQALQSNLR